MPTGGEFSTSLLNCCPSSTVNARFRALCERSGFAENFDACTGVGLRDRAHIWTAAGYLLTLSP